MEMGGAKRSAHARRACTRIAVHSFAQGYQKGVCEDLAESRAVVQALRFACKDTNNRSPVDLLKELSAKARPGDVKDQIVTGETTSTTPRFGFDLLLALRIFAERAAPRLCLCSYGACLMARVCYGARATLRVTIFFCCGARSLV